jgi:invasion protein IalB
MRSVFFINAKAIAASLVSKHTLLIGIPAYAKGEEQIKFEVAGFDAAYKRMKEICPAMP